MTDLLFISFNSIVRVEEGGADVGVARKMIHFL